MVAPRRGDDAEADQEGYVVTVVVPQRRPERRDGIALRTGSSMASNVIAMATTASEK